MKTFKPLEEFQVGKHNIGWVDSDFHIRFPNIEFKERKLGTFQKLGRNMTDTEIESELKPGMCELGDVVAFLENPPEGTKDGWSNLFYTASVVVGVYWRGSYWDVDTWDRDGSHWGAEHRVFSPATESVSLSPSESLDTLSLGRLIKNLIPTLKINIAGKEEELILKNEVLEFLKLPLRKKKVKTKKKTK